MTKLTEYQQTKFDEAMLLLRLLTDAVSEGWGEQEEMDCKEFLTQLCAQIGKQNRTFVKLSAKELADPEYIQSYIDEMWEDIQMFYAERDQLKEENERLKQCTCPKKEILANAIVRAYKEFSEE
jgi:hypothetical protein